MGQESQAYDGNIAVSASKIAAIRAQQKIKNEPDDLARRRRQVPDILHITLVYSYNKLERATKLASESKSFIDPAILDALTKTIARMVPHAVHALDMMERRLAQVQKAPTDQSEPTDKPSLGGPAKAALKAFIDAKHRERKPD